MKAPEWKRPRTTKVYLHRPLSERLGVLFPDFKLLTLPLLDNGTHMGQPGVGLLFLHGKEMLGFDPDETSFRSVEGGLPIYEIIHKGEFLTKVEAFAGGERNPTLYFKVTIVNQSAAHLSGSFGMMPRSGKETYMVNQHQEGYSPYRPNEKNWYMLKRTWKQTDESNAASDMGQLSVASDGLPLSWVTDAPSGHSFAAADYFRVDYALRPGEQTSFFGALRAKEAIEPFDYKEKRAEAVAFWANEVAKIKRYPDTEDERILSVFRHVAMQCLQMLARYEGKDTVSVRQGDIARFVWPYEGSQVLVNLDRIGLSEHTGEAYRGYIDRWLEKEGENAGFIKSNSGWENATGSVLWGISEHLKLTKSKEDFDYFLPYLIMMRDWIQKRRMEPREGGFERIFPAGKGSDWAEVGQFWTFTDSHNCMALRSMCEALAIFGSAEYVATKMIYDDYSEVICDIRDLLHRGHEEDEAYILPHMLGISFEDSENYSYYTDGAPYLLYTGYMEPGSLLQRQMEAFFRNRGQFERGLTGRMTSCSSMWDEAYFGGYGDVWYIMQSETYWIKTWMATGEVEKATETLRACLCYGMTEEFIVAERYCSINPWYSPWQPNGSGSSRVIEMMLTYFG